VADFETAVRARLLADAGVQALAGTRVDWGENAPGGAYPAVRLTLSSSPLGRHMTGFDGWRRPRIQADAMAPDGPAKVRLREAIVAALAPSGTFFGVCFGRAQDVVVSGANEQVEQTFVHRDVILLTLPYLET